MASRNTRSDSSSGEGYQSHSSGQQDEPQLSEIADEVEQVSKEQKELRDQIVQSQSLTISPTLPPEYLEAYEKLCPGAGRKVLLSSHELAEREQEVELELRKREQTQRESESQQRSKRADRGQLYAFLLAGLAVVGGIVLLAMGRDAGGLGAIITPVVGLVAVFIVNRAFPGNRLNAGGEVPNEVLDKLVQKLTNNE